MIKTVGNLARGAVSTAYSAARHPVSTAALTAGLVKGAAEGAVGLVRTSVTGQVPHPRAEDAGPAPAEKPAETPAETPAESVPDTAPDTAPESRTEPAAPESPVVIDVPDPDDLPEPIVIYGDDPSNEAFHTEPKASSRVSEHEGAPGDREEVEQYAEEVIDPEAPELDIETPVGTTGADVGYNPDTAESDLQQPGTEPLLDPATAKAIRSETETLQKAAELEKE